MTDIDDPSSHSHSSSPPESNDSRGESEFTDSQTLSTSQLRFGTAPNMLTLIRIILTPLMVFLLFQKEPFWDWMAGIVFIVAAITDFFDGYLARSQQNITIYGKLLDPLADKFLVVSALIMLQELHRIHPVFVILLVCRELAITGLRALASAEGLIIAASPSAKWKTASQMVAIPLLIIYQKVLGIPLDVLGIVLLYFSLALSLWSAKDYIVDFFIALRAKHLEKRAQRRMKKSHSKG